MSYFETFKKAHELIENDLVSYRNYTTTENSIKFYFEVIGRSGTHQVTLELKKVGDVKPIYQKFWSCDCTSSSMRGLLHNCECSHSMACLCYMIINSEELK